ncbi:MAG: hypothetical protein JO280_01050 [Mycobacteriaceae bacterium]|nr:hypothetical protein [Mycobacteriaceae bacterium]
MGYLESLLRVLVVGLLLGAGLPALFAVGLLAYSNGTGGVDADGTTHAPNPALKYLGVALFLFVAWVIVTAVAWITRATIIHHFGVDLFPFIHTK